MKGYKGKLFGWLLFTLFGAKLNAQAINKYAVFFNSKEEKSFDPYCYFDTRAIERRVRQQLPLYDWYDLPVNENYIFAVSGTGATIKMQSRWLNAVVVLASEHELAGIKALPFVAEVSNLGYSEAKTALIDLEPLDKGLSENDLYTLQRQTERMGEKVWKEKNINGNGIRVAIFDAGFSGADKHPAFAHLHQKGRVIRTRDFVDKDSLVWHGSTHGTGVWSCIAGMVDSIPSGLAWDAEFLLARTENAATEPFSEEENWVAAAEWADKHGADIINSSLGYTDKRYFTYQMDGKSTFVSRGANLAARKGMLVVNAAGNEGSSSWSIIGAPADADSVLTVGGVEVCCDYHISFSSYGPTWDKRLKPNVTAQGFVTCAQQGGMGTSQGTSFASPLVCGFAACAWQYMRDLKNMELFRAIERSGSLYPYFDYAHGYGIPQAARFTGALNVDTLFVIRPVQGSDSVYVELIQQSLNLLPAGENAPSEELTADDLMYYQIQQSNGLIEKYYVINVSSPQPLSFSRSDFVSGQKLRVYYRGCLQEFSF